MCRLQAPPSNPPDFPCWQMHFWDSKVPFSPIKTNPKFCKLCQILTDLHHFVSKPLLKKKQRQYISWSSLYFWFDFHDNNCIHPFNVLFWTNCCYMCLKVCLLLRVKSLCILFTKSKYLLSICYELSWDWFVVWFSHLWQRVEWKSHRGKRQYMSALIEM